MKLGRNDACWCGSRRKYKSCHLAMDEKLQRFAERGVLIPTHAMIKNEEQIAGIREASKLNTEVLDMISEHMQEGISTGELDRLLYEFTVSRGGVPGSLNFEGYPKSVCISINEVVCHGIPDDKRILQSGDIVNVDVTTKYHGYYGDASRMFCIGDVSEEKQRLVRVTQECLDLGRQAAQPWHHLGDIGYAINTHAEANGYKVVVEIGGHGVGLAMHEDPWISHIGQPKTDMLIVPGMIFTIEPMVNMGGAAVETSKEDGWTVRTVDRKPSAQWEYTLLITADGNEILTK